jgi:hypothetical protein
MIENCRLVEVDKGGFFEPLCLAVTAFTVVILLLAVCGLASELNRAKEAEKQLERRVKIYEEQDTRYQELLKRVEILEKK